MRPHYTRGLAGFCLGLALAAPAARNDQSDSPTIPGLEELKQGLPSAEDLFRPVSNLTPSRNEPSGLPLTFRSDWTLAFAEAQAEDRPVLVLFTTPNCIYCRQLKQTTFVQKAVKEAMRRFVLVEINIAQHKGTAYRLNVRGVPALAVFSSDERERGRIQGFVQGPQLIRFLDQMMAAPGEEVETRVEPWLENLKAKNPSPKDWPDILAALGDESIRRAIRDLVFALRPFPAEALIDALTHDQLSARLGALELLEEWAGQSFAVDPWAAPSTPANQDGLARWSTWAQSAPESRATDPVVLSDDRIDAYIRDLAGDDGTAQHRAERMLQHGGERAATRVSEALAKNTHWNEGIRNRMRAIKMGWLIDQIPGWDGHGAAHRLLHANRDIRLDLLRKLAAVPGRGAAILAEFANHPDALVRESALEGMLKSGGATVLPQVIETLKDETNIDVRIAVLRNLGKIEHAAAYGLLAAHLTRPEEDAVLSAIAGLARPKSRAHLQKHIATLAVDTRWRVRARAFEAVHKANLKLDPTLMEAALEDPDSFVQRQALMALIESAPTQALAKVEQLFKTNNELKPALLAAFAQLDSPLPDSLIAHLKTQSKPVQLATLDQVEQMGNHGLSLATAYADHPDDDLASPALRVLARALPTTPAVYPPLVGALQPGRDARALTTLRALQQVTKQTKQSGRSSEPLTRQYDLAATRVTLAPNIPSRMAISPEALIAAFQAASQAKPVATVPTQEAYEKTQQAVAHWLESESNVHRLEAARLLSGITSQTALPILIQRLPALPESERARIFYGVFNDGVPESRELLAAAFTDPALRIFKTAVEALERDRANRAHLDLFLNQLSTRADLPIDLFTGYTFSKLVKHADVKKPLHRWAVQELAQPDATRVNRALLTLFHIGDHSDTPLLLPQLQSDNTWTRRLAVQVIARHDEPKLVSLFDTLWDDPSIEVRSAFLEGLLASGSGSRTVQFHLSDTAQASDRITSPRSRSSAPALSPEQQDRLRDLAENGSAPRLRILAAQALWLRKEATDMTRFKQAVADSSDPAGQWKRLLEFANGNATKLPDAFAGVLPQLNVNTVSEYQVSNLLRRFPELKKSRPKTARNSFRVSVSPISVSEVETQDHQPEEQVTEPSATASEEPALGGTKLIVFYRQGCDDCARVDEWIDEVRSQIPDIVAERIDADQPGSQTLYVQLIEHLNLDASAGKTPAVFAATGALLGEDITVPALADLAVGASGIPASEWDPRLQKAPELSSITVTPTPPVSAPVVPDQAADQKTLPPVVAPAPSPMSPAALPPLSLSMLLLAALGLIPVVLSLKQHRPAALVTGLALYALAAGGGLLIQSRTGWQVPDGWSGDLLASLGGLLPAIICLQRALGSWQEKKEWQGHLSTLTDDMPEGFPILFPVVLGGLIGLLMSAARPPFTPTLLLAWVLPALVLAWVLGPLRQHLPSARSLWASVAGSATYAVGFLAFIGLGLA